ncbi:sigma-54-dependent Fis family transcriptional regulator [Desulfoluna limicola]|uniref:DNA-binding transcriptional regulator NtrC n=1 Tax=Desulfoluna limicola TaxID=2810562 RepID=A0ABM7PLX9_9BACT|nr:sigma-54 dependent transcriptional regulator [Desulfoluna limicola]BCS98531.1 sigma-54-dependent Fis family transcriptional regulator [Desulfoluna limicola]
MVTILIVDDDDSLRASFEKLLVAEGYRVHCAANGLEGIALAERLNPDLAIIDMKMPGMGGLELFGRLKEVQSLMPVIVMTAYGTTETAIEATKMGAFDYVLKPFDIPSLLREIAQAAEAGRFMKSTVTMGGTGAGAIHGGGEESIVGTSSAMQEVYKAIGRVAASDATVLIRGESGTGKELVARAIYQHSDRSRRPFVVINCVAIPETLLESELFGYERGAFTGATHRKIGKIEQAHGGTLFLDEIGDMPLELQTKILRLLQERSIERIGGRETIPVDVRIIAATNRDLEGAIKKGRFREDIYYRLKVVTLSLPPLRERKGDIAILADYFLKRHAFELGGGNPGISREGLRIMEGYEWPGNVRELSNVIQKLLIFHRGGAITQESIARSLGQDAVGDVSRQDPEAIIRGWVRGRLGRREDDLFERLLDECSRVILSEALAATEGNRSQAARLLGISRPTLHARMDKYGITVGARIKGGHDGDQG